MSHKVSKKELREAEQQFADAFGVEITPDISDVLARAIVLSRNPVVAVAALMRGTPNIPCEVSDGSESSSETGGNSAEQETDTAETDISEAEHIRRILREDITLSNKKVIEMLKEKGVKVTSSQVSTGRDQVEEERKSE